MYLLRTVLPAVTSVLLACQGDGPPPRPFDGAQAFAYVEAQLAFGNRIPGTAEHLAMGRWLDSLLRQRACRIGYTSRWRVTPFL